MKIPKNFRLEEKTIKQLELLSAELGLSQADIIRIAVDGFTLIEHLEPRTDLTWSAEAIKNHFGY